MQGELGMAVGVVALFLLMSPAITTMPGMPKALGGWRWKRSQRLGYAALIFVVVHLVVLGVKGWLAPSGWPGGLPPISMIAVVAALIPLVSGKKARQGRTTAYVCENRVCKFPTSDPAVFSKQLRSVKYQAAKARKYQNYSARLNELRLNQFLTEYHQLQNKTRKTTKKIVTYKEHQELRAEEW